MTEYMHDVQYLRLTENRRSLKLLRELNELFAKAFDEPETYSADKPSDEYLSSLLTKKHMIFCVALVDEKVVAGLAGYVLEKFEQERSEVYIYDLAVDKEYRRRHIASHLISFLKEEAIKAGAWVMFIQADREDTPAVKLYESLGLREDVLHFDIRIE